MILHTCSQSVSFAYQLYLHLSSSTDQKLSERLETMSLLIQYSSLGQATSAATAEPVPVHVNYKKRVSAKSALFNKTANNQNSPRYKLFKNTIKMQSMQFW